jgi:penicillin-binding protein 2
MPNPLTIRNIETENKLFSNRIIIAWFVILILSCILTVRMVYLQIINYEHFTTLSKGNRIKLEPSPPRRGLIFDQKGVILADNELTYTLEIIPEQVENLAKLFIELKKFIELKDTDIVRFKKATKYSHRFKPTILRYRLNDEEIAKISVHLHRLEGVRINTVLNRFYPLKELAAHIVGYVGRINAKELKIIDRHNYNGTDYIGKMGIEKFYEKQLHGQVGYEKIEVNVRGRKQRELQKVNSKPGKNLYLSLNINFQKYVANLMKGKKGALVAIEPSTGEVLAMVSEPSYDPNLFVNGIAHKDYNKLLYSPDRPLFNRAVRGQYPPGSTIKPFVGLAGLEYGVRTAKDRIWCRGWYTIMGKKHRYRDWKRTGHGSVNLHRALKHSCDVYFYDLAYSLGINRLSSFMKRFGFGKKTGIDINGELGGLMPSREWKRRARKKLWYPGETLITGIGQGFTLSTPVQLAMATAILSKRGKSKKPHLVFIAGEIGSKESTPIVTPSIEVPLKNDEYWDNAIKGMVAVVHKGGTARKISYGIKYKMAGKTGTAQVIAIKQDARYDASRIAKKYHDHALFIAFAPVDNPKIALALIVENGGSGSRTAAPIARKVIDYYFKING